MHSSDELVLNSYLSHVGNLVKAIVCNCMYVCGTYLCSLIVMLTNWLSETINWLII